MNVDITKPLESRKSNLKHIRNAFLNSWIKKWKVLIHVADYYAHQRVERVHEERERASSTPLREELK